MRLQNQFGTAFRMARQAHGLTQEDFAHESGRTYISELERGLKQPTLQKIDCLAAPLAMHPASLIFMAYLNDYDEPSAQALLKLVQYQVQQIIDRSDQE